MVDKQKHSRAKIRNQITKHNKHTRGSIRPLTHTPVPLKLLHIFWRENQPQQRQHITPASSIVARLRQMRVYKSVGACHVQAWNPKPEIQTLNHKPQSPSRPKHTPPKLFLSRRNPPHHAVYSIPGWVTRHKFNIIRKMAPIVERRRQHGLIGVHAQSVTKM